ncbi:hypothetical protein [Pseudotabrizicola alkalilacus]|uniref:5-aminolevulic acid synthase n=1 Tax=Pseudotabrizicola alkalilacus TaxID=2305252 RepID=A0A411Z3X8_9RHOB|nr:hypothetical protein [Pseudotabrizicola alkalilacus]RGP37786.1 hypothetical protein D1012_07720 [Pseudotabrizicola alkalilacus]
MGKTVMMKAGVLGAALVAGAAIAQAQTQAETQVVPVETGVNGGSAVSLHLHPFLTPEELSTLRLVASNDQALSLFVTSRTGHAALAVSPDEGFVRDGSAVPSAVALGDLPDAEAARTAALAACDGARKAQTPCVVVLEVAPSQ